MIKYTQIPKDILNIILQYNGKIKYRKGIYINIIMKDDYRYNLIMSIIIKKLKIIKESIKKNINGYYYNHIFQRSYYYPNF